MTEFPSPEPHGKRFNLPLRLPPWLLVKKRLDQFTTGGSWADALQADVRHNLRWFWFDGLFAAASDNIFITYFSLFVLALGATGAQIGMLSSLSSLAAALVLLPGALLVERLGYRLRLILWAGGGVARLAILMMVFLPLFVSGPAAVYLAIALSVIRDAFGNLALPAWVSLTADIVPLTWRGRYFSARNVVMSAAGMLTVLATGEMITQLSKKTGAHITGYAAALGVAFVIGMVSTYSFSRIREAHPAPTAAVEPSLSPKELWKSMRSAPGFLGFAATAALWNFSLNVAGPFFTVYLVQGLKATATMVAVTSIASSISSLLLQRTLGNWSDRWGAHRLMLVMGFLIPVLPLSWVFITQPWHVIIINLFGGAFWAGYSLAAFNLQLLISPAEQRARFSAVYQLVVMVAFAAGAAVGGVLVMHWEYKAVFLTSCIGRMFASLLFARFVLRSVGNFFQTKKELENGI